MNDRTVLRNREVDAGELKALKGYDVLTVEDVAKILRMPKTTVYDLCRRGVIPCIKLGRVVRVPTRRFLRELGLLEEEGGAGEKT